DPAHTAHIPAGGMASGELRLHVVDSGDTAARQPHVHPGHRGMCHTADPGRGHPRGVLHGTVPFPGSSGVPVLRAGDPDAATGRAGGRAVPTGAVVGYPGYL